MQRRIRANKLQENRYGTLFPKPTERVIDMSTLDGGLNLWELSYRLNANQSPDLVNVYWKDGCLKSRPGQSYIYHATTSPESFYGCYERLWQNKVIAHKGTKIYSIDPATGAHVSLFTGLTASKGAGFFVFNNSLFYIGGGKYLKINSSLVASEVVPFIPTVVTGRTPAGTGGLDYEPENRIAPGKTILFTADGTSVDYHLPYTNLDNTTVTAIVNGTTVVEGTDFTVNRTTGVVTFDTAPTQSDPQVANNVEITCYKTDSEAIANILASTCLTTYGGDNDLAVIVGGTPSQPNAYFWSGNSNIDLDPTYFPYDYYNYAGTDADNKIRAFGRQQGLLIILQDHAVGKATFESTVISNRTYLSLPYTAINSYIGCDVPGSVQLVTNNLCFANTYGGVYVLANTTSADENNVKRISRNINGNANKGLLTDLRSAPGVFSSFDDNERYWLIANGNAYLWDYSIKGYSANEENLTWFYFSGINAAGFYLVDDNHYYFNPSGDLIKFTPDTFNDFGQAYSRKYVFATQSFGTYEVLKDIIKIVIAVRSDTDSTFNLFYKTDWEERYDRTPVSVSSPRVRLIPRNLTNGRNLSATAYAYPTVRIPRCYHIRHFGLTISNDVINTDIGIISAQIFYRYVREIR